MDRAIPARVTAAVAIAFAHAAAIALLAMHRHAQRARTSPDAPSILVFLPPPERTQQPRSAASARRPAPAEKSLSQPERYPAPDISAITIDWVLAAGNAAARAFEEAGARERQLAAFAPKFSPDVDLSPPPKPATEFGWDRSATNRIEPLEGGGTFVHINERCGIVFAGFIFPVCSLGKIPQRGDLFEHMNDPVAP